MLRLEACGVIDPLCNIGDVINNVAGDVWESWATGIAESFGKIMASLGTYWLYLPSAAVTTGGSGDVVSFLQGSLGWFVGVGLFCAIVVSAIKMMLTQRGEHFGSIIRGLITFLLVNAAGVTAVGLLIVAGDEYSVWIVNRGTTGADYATNMVASLTVLAGVAPLVVVVAGFVAIAASLIQIALMLARSVLLVVMTGMLPLAGSFTGTEMGKQWFTKYVGWLVAFLLYKPVAATIYAAGFSMIGNGVFSTTESNGVAIDATGTGILNVVSGALLMILAIIALAPLMKLIMPAIGAVSAGGMGGAAAAGAGSLASGAMSISHMRSLGGGSGGLPASGSGSSAAIGSAGASAGSGAAVGGGAAAGSGAAAGGAGLAAGAGTGAGAGAAAGTAAGPAGMAVGAAVGVAAGQAFGAASSAVEGLTNEATGSEER